MANFRATGHLGLTSSVNDFNLDTLLDKPATTGRPLAVACRDKVKLPHNLG
jgi:hypothetical protein